MLNPKDAKLLAAKFFTLARNFDEIEGWPVDLSPWTTQACVASCHHWSS